MNEEQFEVKVMDYLADVMTVDERAAFETILKSDETYNQKYKALLKSWDSMQNMNAPEPSESMDEGFYVMLDLALEKTKLKQRPNRLFDGLRTILRPQWALGVVLLALGVAIGYWINTEDTPDSVVLTESSNEAQEIRQKLVLTLLEQPSANQRLQGVSEANKIGSADEIVIKALLQTLNHDANVNVRLAAIESLTHYVDQPKVRQGLVQAIPNQESPILQITLANLMVALQEKSSIEPFRQLLKEKQLDTTVQKKIRTSIESII